MTFRASSKNSHWVFWDSRIYAIAALHGPTPVSEAIEHCETIAAEAEGDRRTKGLVTSILAALLGMHGDFDRARRLSAEARASLGELGPTVAGAVSACGRCGC